jgi:chromosome segregation ATPase
MNTIQLKEKIIMLKEKSEKYDKLVVEYTNYINKHSNILYQNQELTNYNNNLQDKISTLIGEIDDYKGYVYQQQSEIALLNQEINYLEEELEKSHDKISELSTEKDEYVEFSIDLKDRINELQGFANLYHEKCNIINLLTEQINNLTIENQNLKLSQSSSSDLLKTVIDEIGSFEWDIVNDLESNDITIVDSS